jgi:hypothetical protein
MEVIRTNISSIFQFEPFSKVLMTNIYYKSDTVVWIKYSTFVFIPRATRTQLKRGVKACALEGLVVPAPLLTLVVLLLLQTRWPIWSESFQFEPFSKVLMTNIYYKSATVVWIKYSTFVFIPIVIKVDIKLYKVASVAVNILIYDAP